MTSSLARARAPFSRALNGPALVVIVIVAAAIAGALRGGFTDLFVYRYGGQAFLDGLPVYESRDAVTGLPFTYPPFAAVAMAPLAVLPAALTAALWTGASVAALAVVVVVVQRQLGRPTTGWMVALVCVVSLALEPVWQNLTFGQINLLVMAAVLVDLLQPPRRWSGVLVGIAAGVKLTPLVFVVLLILIGRRACARRAVLAFACTVVVGYVAMPASSSTYWSDRLFHAGRVGPPELAHNQSVYGAMARMVDGTPPLWLWLAVALPLAVAVLVVAARWWRGGDRVLGACLASLAMLLASPVSWSHHWVWALPVALALWTRSRWACVAWSTVFVVRPIVWPPYGQDREYDWNPAEHVVGNAYFLAAIALTASAAAILSRPSGSSSPPA